ncbi:MAG TPA: hypothetical protein VFJ64_10505 [Solirubrobacterales bacterium]|nr:hypothetical protein [Solirubrobacterales bacterium]
MLGLASVLAMLVMSLAGASSAMATALTTGLCESDTEAVVEAQTQTTCASIAHVHETSVGKAILLASPKIECNVLFLGEATAGNPLVVEGNFTYSSCGSGCTVTEEGGPSVIEVLKEGHETGSAVGEGEVHVNCIGINCFYNGTGLAGTAKGPLLSTQKNGEVSIQEQEVHKTKGTFCPSTGKLDITTTPLIPTYISGYLHYCVKYEHNTNGRYENWCETKKEGGPNDLVVGPFGLHVGEHVCVNLNVTHTGLYEGIKDYNDCKEDNEIYLSKSLYELGEIILVE